MQKGKKQMTDMSRGISAAEGRRTPTTKYSKHEKGSGPNQLTFGDQIQM